VPPKGAPKAVNGGNGGGQSLSRSGSLPACSEMRRTRTGPSPFELASRPNTIPKAGHNRVKRHGDVTTERPPSAGMRPPSAGRRTPNSVSRPGSAKYPKLDEPFMQMVNPKPPKLLVMEQGDVGDDAVVHVFGEWTAHEDPELGLVFVHTASGQVQTTPPQELIDFIEQEDRAAQNQTVQQSQSEAMYQRIFMKVDKNVPQLLMANDMVAALRQGSTPFEAIQQRFSDAHEEGLLSVQNSWSKEVATCAKSLRVGQVSDPVVDAVGVHILMRVS